MTNASDVGQAEQRSAKRNLPLMAIGAIAIIALCVFGWLRLRDMNTANTELNTQKAEVDECRRRLAVIHTAWTRFAADHKGRDPGSYTDLIPKYLPDAKMLVCPTAERWIAKGANIHAGTLHVNGQQWPVTYGFLVFSASYPVERSRKGDAAVMVACTAHQEGMYQALYHRPPPVGAFDETERMALPDAVRDTKEIVLHKNGTVDLQAAGQ